MKCLVRNFISLSFVFSRVLNTFPELNFQCQTGPEKGYETGETMKTLNDNFLSRITLLVRVITFIKVRETMLISSFWYYCL